MCVFSYTINYDSQGDMATISLLFFFGSEIPLLQNPAKTIQLNVFLLEGSLSVTVYVKFFCYYTKISEGII